MLPTVNGKQLFDCTEEDLEVILNNPDYRENEYLDYKVNFSFLDCEKGDPKRAKHISEFRSDVCAFANSNGGYLAYGISDHMGKASSLVGVDIPDNNTDRFELDRKNNLSCIMPKMPSLNFRFIKLINGKYIVIIHVQKDQFSPYVHVDNESDYRIYKRVGNGKQIVGYVELKNMFTQSLSLEKEIQNFRTERILSFRSIEDTEDYKYSQFLLLHIIPDTFLDNNYDNNLFLVEKKKHTKFSSIFGSVGCANVSVPNVDGLRFPSYRSQEECLLTNNGVAEVFFPLHEYLNFGMEQQKYPYGYFASTAVWDKIEPIIMAYIDTMSGVNETNRLFVCLSIVGCKNVATENNFPNDYNGKIDRDVVMCSPVVFDDVSNDDVYMIIKRFHIEYKLALGIKYSDTMKRLIAEVYPNE